MANDLAFGSKRQFAAVREYLKNCEFTYESVLKRLHEKGPCDVRQLRPEPGGTAPQDEQELMARLFVRGDSISARQLSRSVPRQVREAMTALGLLASWRGAPGRVYAPVALCPVGELFIACDRWSTPANRPFVPASDSVYPPLTLTTQRFLAGIFQSRCEAVLDVCSGSGVAALIAGSGFAQHAVAADITKRSERFAEFNRRLNDLNNVTVVRCDLYEGVHGRTFDRVLAHPPYVPVLRPKWIYHDGGAGGEQITRKIVQGLPRYLRRGGSFHCHALATDRDLPLEERIREWLGRSHKEFDIALVIWHTYLPENWATATVVQERRIEDLNSWNELFRKWRVRRLVDASITIVRHGERRAPINIRRQGGETSLAGEIEWLLRWEQMSTSEDARRLVWRGNPKVAAGVRLTHESTLGAAGEGTWYVKTSYPFVTEVEVNPWVRPLLAACNGRICGAKLYERMRRQGVVGAQMSRDEFADALAALVSYGFIFLPGSAPPLAREVARKNK